jgi:predicted nucleic acid-binding protein
MLVFDSSTLILITKIELLDAFLNAIGMEVAIPEEVESECCSGKKTLDAFIIRKAVDEFKMRVIDVKNKRLVVKLQGDFSLGKGEAEAIALALDEKAALLGIDDKSGINACKLLGISFTTAVDILMRSHERGLIDRGGAIAKLETLAHIGRYKRSILEDAKSRLEKQP